MKHKFAFLLTGAIALVFTLFFYRQSAGINLLLFELILIPLMIWQSGVKPTRGNGLVITAGVAVTAIFAFIHASDFVIIMNVIALFLWTGWLLLPAGRSLVSFAGLAFGNLVLAPVNAIGMLVSGNGNHQRTMHRVRQTVYFVIPLFLILFFLAVYRSSNPWFESITDNIFSFFDRWLNLILNYIDVPLAGVLFVGFCIGILFVFRYRKEVIPAWDEHSPEIMHRERQKKRMRSFSTLALKSEYRAGVFLLVVLNLLILVQNLLDIWFVWFNFEWNGQYLMQFIHEGTWLLIFSILISICIILWLYRGNQNFIPGNKFLRQLSYAWLIQNMVLAVSVAVRNGWYICYFALAYKRIGVALFLIMTLIGLFTVVIKVKERKTLFYLLRVNFLAAFILLAAASCVNWDPLIARYNFAGYQRSFVHLDWLCTLSDKALPMLDKSSAELDRIRQVQDKNFSFEYKYMSPAEYAEKIRERRKEFFSRWESRGWLSFNLADWQAYTYFHTQDQKKQ